MGEKKVYYFGKQLDYSMEASDLGKFDEFYKSAFGEITSIERVHDLETQKRGIDVYLHYANGPLVSIDEKKDSKSRPTIFLEIYSDVERSKLSWLFTAECDYIVYFFTEDNEAYILPVRALRHAYCILEDVWLEKYPLHTIMNKSWTAVGIGVPKDVLLKAVWGSRKLPITQ